MILTSVRDPKRIILYDFTLTKCNSCMSMDKYIHWETIRLLISGKNFCFFSEFFSSLDVVSKILQMQLQTFPLYSLSIVSYSSFWSPFMIVEVHLWWLLCHLNTQRNSFLMKTYKNYDRNIGFALIFFFSLSARQSLVSYCLFIVWKFTLQNVRFNANKMQLFFLFWCSNFSVSKG